MMPRSRIVGLLFSLTLVVAACGDRSPATDSARTSGSSASGAARPSRVDSILPIEEELRRFRADLSDTARALRGGASTRDALVQRFVAAVETSDTLAIRDMLLTASEFAWLYYPTSINVQPRYELGPGISWFQLQNGSSKGISRLWRRFSGGRLGVTGHACPSAPLAQGDNRLWTDCTVSRVDHSGDTTSVRMFGAIIERDGRYKFLSYANDL